ncbi:hypothetical protein SAMN03159390_00586 [Pseudomonas sp. NFACC49-2]|uniref:hypothetical protein n=1 Tax=Pseudomonas sp. NFACC49-2 TaxID=1566222 RepID=UPI000920C37A|nr:hypothetical protein [Pseudomonas sp. NFACC49-2]SFX16496.1 hypothetical protein SAMN03159390_00586 [Pseudomonas sp. NFACC49-2]
MPEENESTLRQRITTYMSGDGGTRDWFCTWWFKFHVSGARDTPEIRRELERMERDGLVESDRSQRNNTKWRLVKQSAEVNP